MDRHLVATTADEWRAILAQLVRLDVRALCGSRLPAGAAPDYFPALVQILVRPYRPFPVVVLGPVPDGYAGGTETVLSLRLLHKPDLWRTLAD